MTTEDDRNELLAQASYNLFNLAADNVGIDLLTDSGTSAMSADQWSALMRGDESYAGASSYYELARAVQDIFGYQYFLPVHQGRAAENILFGHTVSEGRIVVSNPHFDTTGANVEHWGGQVVDLLDASDPQFPGGIDLAKLEEVLAQGQVALVVMTLTNNAAGGLPVSMNNLDGAYELARKHQVPLFIDGARMFENAWFIQQQDSAHETWTIPAIVRTLTARSDGLMMSSKKDGLVNMGGLLCMNNQPLYEQLRVRMAIQEGFITYGGLTGRDMHALSVGLREGMNVNYLNYRIGQVHYLGRRLKEIGVPVVEPFGGSAIFVNAGKFLSHIPDNEFPGQALAVELYKVGGIRSCEIGSVMFGPKASRQLLRLAIPRRVYLREHMDAVVQTFLKIKEHQEDIPGYQIVSAPAALRHFFATFSPII